MTAGDPKSRGYEPAHLHDVDSEPLSLTSWEYKRHPVYSRSEWLYETITLVISLGLLGGIVCIFWYMDGKLLSDWPGPVSLTATISILTTCCTAAMMHSVSQFISQLKWLYFGKGRAQKLAQFETFDEASRGPWGSIMLLTTVKWNLATLGALITIFRLSFAPLAQQVLAFPERDNHTEDYSVTFGYSHNFSYPRPGTARGFGVFDGITQDPGLQAAIVQGLYGIRSLAEFSCPGICDWNGSYISLGFSSACSNVTEATLQTESCGSVNYWKVCNMTTPGGVMVSTRLQETVAGTSYYMNVSSLVTDIANPNDMLRHSLPVVVRFAIYRSTPSLNMYATNINITDCSLFLTAYQYTHAKANGSDFSFEQVRELDFGVENPWNVERTTVLGSRVYTDVTEANNISIPALQIGWADLAALGNYLKSRMFVTEWVEGNYENSDIGLTALFYGDADIDKPFERMAKSMTDYLRRSPDALAASGERVNRLTYVQIHWWYLIGPAAIQLMAVLFGITTIFINRKSRRVPLWKSSALAVLACQHEQQLGIIHSKVKDIKQIEKAAEKAKVRLE
ncbi:uncharacterized protein DSM5745_07117 [Aspergillus mulundensis]|uniref:Uncharacterized protein n=1 Tax=Aspergillus mulundensis TaxID=1810919 RepID=A0A3D8RK83_9EURO|nr:Uncharacterized protein DSM5745_07117 [Aspergillus mulundensis]RDW74455.1 Uncharacterized protein DSM5745_07117 [Aspergillus mulundensis]